MLHLVPQQLQELSSAPDTAADWRTLLALLPEVSSSCSHNLGHSQPHKLSAGSTDSQSSRIPNQDSTHLFMASNKSLGQPIPRAPERLCQDKV